MRFAQAWHKAHCRRAKNAGQSLVSPMPAAPRVADAYCPSCSRRKIFRSTTRGHILWGAGRGIKVGVREGGYYFHRGNSLFKRFDVFQFHFCCKYNNTHKIIFLHSTSLLTSEHTIVTSITITRSMFNVAKYNQLHTTINLKLIYNDIIVDPCTYEFRVITY